jgi:hypothetical protein
VASLLLSAAKIDRDQNNEGGIYENLFTSLRSLIVDSLTIINETRDKFIISGELGSMSSNTTL